MQKSIANKDFKTKGYVLQRTNYGESDRILNLITPLGKIAVMAKSVRKPRSKLAGAVELFTLSDYNIHLGHSELGILTGARMIEHYSNILKDFNSLKLAGFILKKVNAASEHTDSKEYFELVNQSLSGLNQNYNPALVEAWFLLHLTKATGEEINLYRDTDGVKLSADQKYDYDITQTAFTKNPNGKYGENEIKALRLFTNANLKLVHKIKLTDENLAQILDFARIVAHL